MSSPTVALIISTYNSPAKLKLTLESVVNQSVMPMEVIIADDGSKQDTRGVVEAFRKRLGSRLHHCWHPDKGFRLAAIRNRAIEIVTADYIISIDGDLILHRDFVRDHLQICEPGKFVQGSRVLVSGRLTSEILDGRHRANLAWYSQGVTNRFNAIHNLFFSVFLGNKEGKPNCIKGIRGCNMAFWRKDCIAVNGFNEDICGWGREDSEFVARLENHHIRRRNLKFGGIVYHLFHEENSRDSLTRNDAILQNTMHYHLVRCENGISKYNYAHTG